ncbi:Uncharacterised protein [Streptococcus pneumoniae]|nr:Uncharacterised protein [Streptococcus pneumoniae]
MNKQELIEKYKELENSSFSNPRQHAQLRLRGRKREAVFC